VADTLIYPVGGEEINEPNGYLVWKLNTSRRLAESSTFIVLTNPDFTYRVTGGTSFMDRGVHPDGTIFNEPFDIYNDCSTYYWKTGETVGETTLWSDVATFRTNFGNVCTGIGPLMGDLVNHFRFDCINPNLSVIVFEFTAPVQGKYTEKGDNQTWNCEFQAGDNQTLIYTGPYVKENVSKMVTLMDETLQKIVLTRQMTSPICELSTPAPVQCKEPAVPCIQFGCVWNPDSYRCEENGGACPGQ
jgi:hypothetical protein